MNRMKQYMDDADTERENSFADEDEYEIVEMDELTDDVERAKAELWEGHRRPNGGWRVQPTHVLVAAPLFLAAGVLLYRSPQVRRLVWRAALLGLRATPLRHVV